MSLLEEATRQWREVVPELEAQQAEQLPADVEPPYVTPVAAFDSDDVESAEDGGDVLPPAAQVGFDPGEVVDRLNHVYVQAALERVRQVEAECETLRAIAAEALVAAQQAAQIGPIAVDGAGGLEVEVAELRMLVAELAARPRGWRRLVWWRR